MDNKRTPSQSSVLSLHLHGLIEEEILSRLPVKSLLRFRCVSKPWRYLIDNNRFIRKHLENYTNKTTDCDHWKTILECWDHGIRQHGADESSYNSYWDEPLLQPSPINDPENNHLMSGTVVGCCNGLFCIFKQPCSFFFWNPAIKICIELPKIDAQNLTIRKQGFGWDEESDAYKVFVEMYDQNTNKIIAQVYSWKTNSWRRVEYGSLPVITERGTLACGKIHWLAQSGGNVHIESFDLKSEVFGTTELPRQPEEGVQTWLSEVKGSLRVVSKIVDDDSKCRVWVMKEYGVKESWVEQIKNLHTRSPCCIPKFYSESLVSPILFKKKN